MIDWIAELTANRHWLARVVYARIGDQEAVEDVLQELALAASAWPHALDGSESINRWLYSVAVRQALMVRRTQSRASSKMSRYAAVLAVKEHTSDDPLNALIASENAERVHDALKELPPRQQEVLLLKYFENLSCRDIAVKFGIAESTTRRHLVNARARLRERLFRHEDKKYE